jgi:hypothetical protein
MAADMFAPKTAWQSIATLARYYTYGYRRFVITPRGHIVCWRE